MSILQLKYLIEAEEVGVHEADPRSVLRGTGKIFAILTSATKCGAGGSSKINFTVTSMGALKYLDQLIFLCYI